MLNNMPGLPSGITVRDVIERTIEFEIDNTTEVYHMPGPGSDKIESLANAKTIQGIKIKLNADRTDLMFEREMY